MARRLSSRPGGTAAPSPPRRVSASAPLRPCRVSSAALPDACRNARPARTAVAAIPGACILIGQHYSILRPETTPAAADTRALRGGSRRIRDPCPWTRSTPAPAVAKAPEGEYDHLLAARVGNALDNPRSSELVFYVMVGGRIFDALSMNEIAGEKRQRKPFWFQR